MSVLRSVRVVLLALLALPPMAAPLGAARDTAAPATPRRMELLVLEVRNCSVCRLVRERIQPEYEQSARARDVPMRFVDITTLDETRLGLKSRVDTLPTIVLMQDGQEVDRITGYLGPEAFFRVLAHMIGSAD